MEQSCVVCGSPAKHRCSRCSEGVDIDGHPTSTWYCGTSCQRPHWPTHKADCKSANLRKQLYRAADLLQAAFYIQTRNCWSLEVKVERSDDGRLHVQQGPGAGDLDFLDQLPVVEQNAVLSHRSSVDVSTHMTEIVKQALKGTVAGYDELTIVPKLTPLTQWNEPSPALKGHILLHVRLADGSRWALDLACARFANLSPLMPWDRYADLNVESIMFTVHAGSTSDLLDECLSDVVAEVKSTGKATRRQAGPIV